MKDHTVENLNHIIDTYRTEARERDSSLQEARQSATFWRESFEQLAGDVGDLLVDIREGRRPHVDIEDLERVLDQQVREVAP
jgi:predicted Zn-dependent peptidase